jgi:alanine racemase
MGRDQVTHLDAYYRPTRAEISFDALRHNIQQFRQQLGPDIALMAVVKSNGYGHGAVAIARESVACGIDALGVAFLDEALELRRADITAPILVMGYTSPNGFEIARAHDITLTVYSEESLQAIRAMNPDGERALKVHVKVDTGMGRLGLHVEADAIAYVQKLMDTPGVVVEGLFTHFASADETDKASAMAQYAKFKTIVAHFEEQGITFPIIHAGNSATGIDLPAYTFNMLRLGISLYGLYPSDEVDHHALDLQPILRLVTGVSMVKTLPAGSGVSYGSIYVTKADETIATLPIGYADGFTRLLTNKADVLVQGKRVPVVGRICMDQCMVRIADGQGPVEVGEEAVLIGEQGDERITADELAQKLGTINYEIVCMLSNRVPRVYMRNGQVVLVENALLHS